MNWINLYGLFFMLVIMIPNIVFAVKSRTVSGIYGKTRSSKYWSR